MNYLNIFQVPQEQDIQAGNVWTIPVEHQWTKLPLKDNTVYLVVTNWCGYSKAAKEPFLQFIKQHGGYFIDYDDPKFQKVLNVSGVPTVFVMRNGNLHKIAQKGTIQEQLQKANKLF